MLTITGVEPANGSKDNLQNTLIEFTIVDDGSGIDINSLVVEINGERALLGSDFLDEWSGDYSEINVEEGSIGVVLDKVSDFKIDEVVNVKIQIKNLEEKYFNFNFAFKIKSDIPYVFFSTPQTDDILVTPQKIYLDIRDEFDNLDILSVSITLNNLVIYQNLEFKPPFNGPQSSFLNDGSSFKITIDPEEFIRDGKYTLNIKAKDSIGNKLDKTIRFSVKYTSPILPPVFPQGGFVGFFQGIVGAVDNGDGSGITISWSRPASRFYNSDIALLIFYSDSRLDLFDGLPKLLAKSSVEEAVIPSNILRLGTGYYFGVRTLESYKDSINFAGMEESSPDVFVLPQVIKLVEQLDKDGSIIKVSDVTGYPQSGFLLINTEVIKYDYVNVNDNSFLIPVGGRGLNNTVPSFHDVDDDVSMFLLCQDDNQVIVSCSASYQEPTIISGRTQTGTGLIIPDFSDFEKLEHDGLDHCGYHKPLPWEVLNNKNDCGTYLGGEYNGFRGVDIFQRAMDREEELMENVGEKCVLLRRKWDGQTCSCVTLKRQHPKIRSCKFCYGTGIVGGYDQVFNLRRADKRVMVRFYEQTEDLKLGDHQHFMQDFQPTALALFKPIIKDRDVIIRFDFTGDPEYIYEVLNVGRERFVFNKYGRQKLSLIRLDKTDSIYQVPYVL